MCKIQQSFYIYFCTEHVYYQYIRVFHKRKCTSNLINTWLTLKQINKHDLWLMVAKCHFAKTRLTQLEITREQDVTVNRVHLASFPCQAVKPTVPHNPTLLAECYHLHAAEERAWRLG